MSVQPITLKDVGLALNMYAVKFSLALPDFLRQHGLHLVSDGSLTDAIGNAQDRAKIYGLANMQLRLQNGVRPIQSEQILIKIAGGVTGLDQFAFRIESSIYAEALTKAGIGSHWYGIVDGELCQVDAIVSPHVTRIEAATRSAQRKAVLGYRIREVRLWTGAALCVAVAFWLQSFHPLGLGAALGGLWFIRLRRERILFAVLAATAIAFLNQWVSVGAVVAAIAIVAYNDYRSFSKWRTPWIPPLACVLALITAIAQANWPAAGLCIIGLVWSVL